MSFRSLLKIIIRKTLNITYVHAFGDSHGLIFKKFESNTFKTCIIQGATVSGITNPNSQTQAYPKFKKYIEKFVVKGDYIIVELGEVDCGFVLWYKKEKNNENMEELLITTLNKYKEFLSLIISKQKKPQRLFVLSTIPPTIKDNQDWGEVANLRKTIEATQMERTMLTVQFNKKLKKIVHELGGIFIDLDNELIDPKSKLVKNYYLNENPLDHHLSQEKLGKLIMNNLKNKGLDVKLK
jgi:hypothetical protein